MPEERVIKERRWRIEIWLLEEECWMERCVGERATGCGCVKRQQLVMGHRKWHEKGESKEREKVNQRERTVRE